MTRNDPRHPNQRVNIIERGESFLTRAKLIACVHGFMREGHDHATFIAIEFNFVPLKSSRRARMAMINLVFTGETRETQLPRVAKMAPQGNITIRESMLNTDTMVGGVKSGLAGVERLWATQVGGAIKIETSHSISRASISGATIVDRDWGLPNGARWMIQEDESTKIGIPERLVVAVLLIRSDQKLFRMTPNIELKVSGSAFEQAFARQPPDDPVILDPEMPPVNPMSFNQSTSYETNLDRNNLEDFWQSHAANIAGIEFHFRNQRLPWQLGSNLPSDYLIPATDGREATEVPSVEALDDSTESMQGQGPEAFNKAILGAVYTEVWDTKKENNYGTTPLKFYWEDMGGSVDEGRLSEHFWWIREELDLPVLPKVKGEGQDLEANDAENTRAAALQPPMEGFKTRHTSCSLVTHKAREKKWFKSFQDLSQHLFDDPTINSILECFEIDKQEYDFFRRLDLGSCEIRSTGSGKDLNTFYIIQTPYYRNGFWSMFLVGKADPEDPEGARKLSGLIQGGADVNLQKILTAAASKAKSFNYHPLLLPYELYVSHFENTSQQFDAVFNTLDEVEQGIMMGLDNERGLIDSHAKSDAGDGMESNHQGLTKLSRKLHEASRQASELALRRQFQDELAKTLYNQLQGNEPEECEMRAALSRYDRWTRGHQLDIDGMPARIESLRNLLYSMIAQQDNVVSIKLAKEALSDSKAMKTLSIVTILFLPGTFVATLFTTNVVSFQDSTAETMIYITAVIPLTVGLMILYGLWHWAAPAWSKRRERKRDEEHADMSKKQL